MANELLKNVREVFSDAIKNVYTNHRFRANAAVSGECYDT